MISQLPSSKMSQLPVYDAFVSFAADQDYTFANVRGSDSSSSFAFTVSVYRVSTSYLYHMHILLEEEKSKGIGVEDNAGVVGFLRKFKDLVAAPRNRRALYASELVMFMQQVSTMRSRTPRHLNSLIYHFSSAV